MFTFVSYLNGKKMGEPITIHGVTIGDVFETKGKFPKKAIVVDFISQISVCTGEGVGYLCIAQLIDGLSTNAFEVPFATVQVYKLKNN